MQTPLFQTCKGLLRLWAQFQRLERFANSRQGKRGADMRLPSEPIEKCASKEDSRYTITHLCYEPEKERVFATNGHALAIAHVETDQRDTKGVINQEVVKRLRSFGKKSVATVRACKNMLRISRADVGYETYRREVHRASYLLHGRKDVADFAGLSYQQ